MKKIKHMVTAIVTTGLVAGCAGTVPNAGQRDKNVSQKGLKKASANLENQGKNDSPGLSSSNGSYVSRKPVNYQPPSGTISLNAQGAPIGQVLQQVVGKRYSVTFTSVTSARASVTVQLNKASRRSAIRQVAASAGYAAVIQPKNGRVLISNKATYVFHIPMGYLRRGTAKYDVGGNTAAGQSSSGSGGGMGGGGGIGGGSANVGSSSGSGSGSGGKQVTADFHVHGSDKGDNQSQFESRLQRIAGKKSQVVVNKFSGLVTVTASGPGLARIDNFLQSYSRQANTRVKLHAAVLQVSLTGRFQAGINWSKLISLSSNSALRLVSQNPAPAIGNAVRASRGNTVQASSQLNYTSASLSTVINALKKNGGVRIISRPSLVAGNGTPATFFSGKQLPYVGSVQSNTSGLSGTTTSGSSLSYVLNGLELSFLPEVVSNQWVNLKLIPALSRVERFDKFEVDGNTLTGPEQALRQVYLQMLTPTNHTVILAGSKETSGASEQTETPVLGSIPILGNLFKGLSRSKKRTQLVILIRADILPAPRINPLVSESL